jgi:DNA topoisomerase-1
MGIFDTFRKTLSNLTRRVRYRLPYEGAQTLLVVESPTKAETLREMLKDILPGVTIRASQGHLRDLPAGHLAVDVANNFKPEFEVDARHRTTAEVLSRAAVGKTTILLATDPDFEGEGVAWHAYQFLKGLAPGAKTWRVSWSVFEQEAVLAGLRNPQPLDLKRAQAAIARRVGDRLIGYLVSPILWRTKLPGVKGRPTAAGRVQSAALNLLADHAAKAGDTWTVEMDL